MFKIQQSLSTAFDRAPTFVDDVKADGHDVGRHVHRSAMSASRERHSFKITSLLSQSTSDSSRDSASCGASFTPIELPKKAYLNPYRHPHLSSTLSLDECCLSSRKDKEPRKRRGMALSKSSRIILLLAIDSAFFLLEITVGMCKACASSSQMLTERLRFRCTLACIGCRCISYGSPSNPFSSCGPQYLRYYS